jgi:RsiW-degrading membrane proteinase PrsW (M82 family)
VYLLLTIACAVLPSLLLIRFFYKRDLNPEPRRVLLATFLLGVLTIVPVLIVSIPGLLLMPDMVLHPAIAAAFMAFGLAALPEELFKFLVVVGYCSRHREFNEPMDGMVYGAIASLGFATLENILYVTGGGLGTAVARALTAVPSHAFVGAIMGYYVAQWKFGPTSARAMNLILALFVPLLLHGLYDFPLMLVTAEVGEAGDVEQVSLLALVLLLVPFAVLIVEGVIALRLLRRLRALQERIKAEQTLVAE